MWARGPAGTPNLHGADTSCRCGLSASRTMVFISFKCIILGKARPVRVQAADIHDLRFNAHGRYSTDCPRSLALAVIAIQSVACLRRNAWEVLTRRLKFVILLLLLLSYSTFDIFIVLFLKLFTNVCVFAIIVALSPLNINCLVVSLVVFNFESALALKTCLLFFPMCVFLLSSEYLLLYWFYLLWFIIMLYFLSYCCAILPCFVVLLL